MDMKYEKLVRSIRDGITSGSLKPGSRLPSIRETAVRSGCSRNTVLRAYAELERDHVIFSVPKSGYYVVEKPEAPSTGDVASKGLPDVCPVDMASAAPDESAMPYEDFRHCLNRAIDLYRDKLFNYGDPQGMLSLRELLAKRLYGDQIFVNPEQIFVVSGSQQAIHLLAGMPFPNGKSRLLIEQPTYFGILRSAALQGQTSVGIARSPDGEIDLNEVERQFRHNDIKLFYTVPRYQNPYGCSYTTGQKKEIVRLAEKYGVYILEDDYLGDLDADKRNEPMKAYDRSGHVIYLRSFSKTVLPGMRLGVAVVPPALVQTLRSHKAAADSTTSALTQGALEIYLKSGMFDRHLLQIRKLYQERMSALASACSRHLPPEAGIRVHDNGIFAAVELPSWVRTSSMVSRLAQLGLLVTDAQRMFLPGFESSRLLRLSIIRASEEQIEKGVRILAAEIRHAMKASPDVRLPEDWPLV